VLTDSKSPEWNRVRMRDDRSPSSEFAVPDLSFRLGDKGFGSNEIDVLRGETSSDPSANGQLDRRLSSRLTFGSMIHDAHSRA